MTCKIEFWEPEATAEEAERGATPFETPGPLGSTPSLIPSLGKKEGLCHKTELEFLKNLWGLGTEQE
jgi:hypothetical protein